MARVLVVGELCPDIVVTGVPVADGRLRFGQAEDLVAATRLTLGASAAITSCAVARAGTDVSLVAVVGDDDLGRMCLAWVGERGVDVTAVRVAPGRATGSTVILVDAADCENRQMLTDLGTMVDLVPADLPDQLLAGYDHLHVSSFFLHTSAREHLHERLRRARANGSTVSLDTNDDPDRMWGSGAAAAIAQTDVLFCNDTEAVGLAGLGRGSTADQAVAALLARMPDSPADARLPAVVHKLGAAGARVVTDAGTVHVAAPQVAVVDTVGAGDTLAGTVIAALLAGADWQHALARGVAAGSLSTTATGGVTAQPSAARTTALAATLTISMPPGVDAQPLPGGRP